MQSNRAEHSLWVSTSSRAHPSRVATFTTSATFCKLPPFLFNTLEPTIVPQTRLARRGMHRDPQERPHGHEALQPRLHPYARPLPSHASPSRAHLPRADEYILQSSSRSAADALAPQDVAPEPLLPNYGVGRVRPFYQDLNMMSCANAKERTLDEFVGIGCADVAVLVLESCD